MNLKTVLNKIQKSLRKENAGILIENSIDTFYLSTFPSTYSKIFISSTNIYFITDNRYKLEAEKKLPPFFTLKIQTNGFLSLLQKLIKKEKIKSLLIDSSFMTVQQHQLLSENLNIPLLSVSRPIDEYKIQKSYEEISKIKQAQHIADQAFLDTMTIIRPGISEKDIKIELEYQFTKAGADTIAFDTIVATGPNSAIPHAHVSDRKIQNKDIVLIDFGARFMGYNSDTTRTLHVGKPTALFKKRYNIIKNLVELCEEKAQTKMKAADLDIFAREHLKKQKLSRYFTHSLGHGVGLEIHEKPFLNYKSQDMLLSNMVFTIEPGIYFKNWGGIRIEDMMILKKSSSQVLTKLTKDLIIL